MFITWLSYQDVEVEDGGVTGDEVAARVCVPTFVSVKPLDVFKEIKILMCMCLLRQKSDICNWKMGRRQLCFWRTGWYF